MLSVSRAPSEYYPLCASFINLVNLMCQLTQCREAEQLELAQQTPLFKLIVAEEPDAHAFEQLFVALCVVFDNVWRATKSEYWDFPALYDALKRMIEHMLRNEPKDF